MADISAIRARQNVYSDLDFRFIANPNTQDLALKYDVESVKQSVINILLTNAGERPFNPKFGGGLNGYLFDNFDGITAAAMENTIVNTLRNWEPRVRVDKVDITDLSHRNALRVSLEITILSPEERTDIVEFVVERLR
jgi:phage baseplate assembly protein W